MATVLIVDDAPFMRLMLKQIVVVAGHEVVGEAGDGLTALGLFRQLAPDLTTLDVTMPDHDGLTILQEMLEINPDARVIMCSAQGQQNKVVESMKLGARDFVVKPFKQETVLQAIEHALS
jgi:two-component system, chemotaxis family, chemotaxis protein CheY